MNKKLKESFAGLGIGIEHHFTGGVYAKETHIPAGVELTQHIHDFDHLSILACGTVVVDVDGVCSTYQAPAAITILAGLKHTVQAISDVVWFCIHATNETEPEFVDEEIILKAGD